MVASHKDNEKHPRALRNSPSPVLLHPTEGWRRVIKTDCPQGTIRHLKGNSLG